ncbi:hypothetical protein EON66_10915, partial [archaeon]
MTASVGGRLWNVLPFTGGTNIPSPTFAAPAAATALLAFFARRTRSRRGQGTRTMATASASSIRNCQGGLWALAIFVRVLSALAAIALGISAVWT